MNAYSNIAVDGRKPWRWRWALVAVACVILLLVLALLFVGRWLVVEDPLAKADALVVLSGRMPERAQEAAKIYAQGYAPEVWITKSTSPEAELRSMGIDFHGEEYFSAQVAEHDGVPANSVKILDTLIVNTADEMRVISDELERRKLSRVIIVTTKAHTRRVHVLWRRIARPGQTAIVRAAETDSFDPGRWWASTSGALDVVREVLGLFNAWVGLPVQPAR